MREQNCPEPTTYDPINTAQQYTDASIDRQQQEYQKAKLYPNFPSEGSLGATSGCSSYSNPRRIIDRLIDYHNRQSVQLHALLRALPQDLSHDAEQALYDLAKTALGGIR